MAAGTTGTGMRRCAVCGKMTPANEEFCLECGSPASAQPAPAAPAPPHAATAQPSPSTTGSYPVVAAATAPPAQGAPTCPKCGRPYREGARFCTNCGAPLSAGVLARGQTLAGR